jgi:hypothetical protein
MSAMHKNHLSLKHLFINDIAASAQVRAQFAMNVSGESYEKFRELLDNAETVRRVSNGDLAKLLPGCLEYGKLVEPLAIPGGWDTERCAFNMILEHEGPFDTKVQFFIAGFTSKRPVNTILEGKEIDWDGVEFHVNYIASYRSMFVRTETGEKSLRTVTKSDVVITDRDYDGIGTGRLAFRQYRIRPGDVFSSLDAMDIMAEDPNVVDTRTLVTSLPSFSRRSHAIPSVWLGDIIRAHADSLSTAVGGWGQDHARSLARGIVMDQVAGQDPFIQALSQTTGMITSKFTMAALRCLFENVDDVGIYVTNTENDIAYEEGEEEWHSAAVLAGVGVPGIMGDLGISVVRFYATNMTSDRTAMVGVHDMTTMFGEQLSAEDFDQILETFKQRLIEELLPLISYNDQRPFNLRVAAHIGGHTQVILGNPGLDKPHVRTVATYADSLLSPLVYSDSEAKQRIAIVQDVSNILSLVPVPTDSTNDEDDDI